MWIYCPHYWPIGTLRVFIANNITAFLSRAPRSFSRASSPMFSKRTKRKIKQRLCMYRLRLNWKTTNNVATLLSNQVNNQSLIPLIDVIQLTFDSEDYYRTGCRNVGHCNNSPIQDLTYPQPSYEPCLPHPAPAQAPVTLNREFSGEIRTIIIPVIIIRGEKGEEKTLKLSKTPQTLCIVKLQAHVDLHA